MSLLSDAHAREFIEFIKKTKNIDLSGYRESFVSRRLSVRLLAHKIKTLPEYIDIISSDAQEWDKFFDNLCINVSEFFRDPEVFKRFTADCIPDLVRVCRVREHKTINIWSCGCSCGEESYSLAITFQEFFKNHNITDITFRVIATDVDMDALMKARQGVYSKDALVNVHDEMRASYFTFVPKAASMLDADTWQVNNDVRKLVAFERHNLIADVMPKDMDVIFLRNVRIYFDKARAKDILLHIHSALREHGVLVLGKIESVGINLRHMFKSVDAVNRIYRKI